MKSLIFIRKVAWGVVAVLAIIVLTFGVIIYKRVFTANVLSDGQKSIFLLIPTDADFEKVVEILDEQNLLLNEKSFRWVAREMKYTGNIRPGRYLLKPKMNNKELVTLLRSGRQTPVQVTFNNIRSKEQLAERIGLQIEARPQSILNLINDNDYTNRLGFSSSNILAMFIPNTYEFYWNTSADKFLLRMKKEYDKFWTIQRLEQAKKINFSPLQVSVLASIVQMESNREDEKPVIAGVYINRLRKNWKLEADPTLVFALGDYSITRVLSVYKEIDSPYNTYMYSGLPPGPICLPTIKSLAAVLNYVPSNYMYFCAKEDFSGYHAFAATYEKHLLNARRFQRALNQRGIRS